MPRLKISSSVIAAVEYDEERETLDVEFRNGRRYVYRRVPRQVYDELLAAPSKGQFFNDRIRGVYPFGRIG
jgi:KTSC domain